MELNKSTLIAAGVGIGALVAVYLIAGASAAKADPFTGCYVGAGVGYGAANTDVSATDGKESLGIDGIGSTGWAGNVTAGCDRQFERVVVGLFGDYVWHDSDTKIYAFGDSANVIGLDTQWTVGGRLGYVIAPTTMAYVLAAYTELDMGDALDGEASIGKLDGYQLGAGIEAGLGAGWFIDARYTVSFLDKKSFDLGFEECESCSLGIEPEVHVGRVGLTYRFNFDPVSPIK